MTLFLIIAGLVVLNLGGMTEFVDEHGESLWGRCGWCERSVDNHDELHRVTSIVRGGRGVECVLRGDIGPQDARPLGMAGWRKPMTMQKRGSDPADEDHTHLRRTGSLTEDVVVDRIADRTFHATEGDFSLDTIKDAVRVALTELALTEWAAADRAERDEMNVQVPVVRCTVCDVPYVLRFSLRMTAPAEWLYQRDCNHKTGLPSGTLDRDKVETAPLVVLSLDGDNE